MARDYRKEYDNYQSRPDVMKKRAMRNKARRIMERKGLVHKGDGMDVNHIDGNAMNTTTGSTKNLQVQSASANRSYPRTKDARKKNPKD